MWKGIGLIIVSTMQRVTNVILARLYNNREGIFVITAIGVGVMLALGLCSPARDLVTAIAGVSVYVITIVMNPLKGLLLWLITQPLLRIYLNISLGRGIPDLSLTRLCLALVTVLLLARTAVGLYRLQPLSKFDIVAFLFMVGIMQAGPRGIRGIASAQHVFDIYWLSIVTYFAVRNQVTDRRSLHLVLYAVLSVALYSAVYALYETTTGNILFTEGQEFKHYFYKSSLRILRGIWRSNEGFGRVLVMGIPVNFYFYLKTSSPARKALWATCLALVFVGLFLTYKRIAWIAMVAVVFFMQFFYPQFRRLFIVLLIVVVIAIAFNWDRISTSTAYTSRVQGENASGIEGRTEGWEHALEFWAASPLLGHGYQQYRNLARAHGYKDVDVESEYLNILVSAGLVGFLPYIGLLLLMAYDGLQHYRGRVTDSLADRDLIAVFWGILIGYAINTSTASVNNLAIPSMLFAAAGAIIYARSSPSSSSEMEVMRGRMPLRWRSNVGSQKH